MTTMMRGFERLRLIIKSYLNVSMPYYVDVARDQWTLDEFSLPYPTVLDVVDPTLISNAQYPGIGIYAGNDSRHVRNDVHTDGSQEYQSNWLVRILVAARTPLHEDGSTWMAPEKEEAARLCTDLTRIMHNALLQTPGCGRPEEVFMEETTMATDYLEPMMPNTQSKRWVAMSVTSVDFRFTERTFALPYGEVNTIINEVQKLTP